MPLEPAQLPDGAVGVDLRDLLPRDVADRVEVVDVQVAEDSTRSRDELLCRRRRVVGGGSNDEQVAERTRGDRFARGAIPRVEATLKADLDEDPGPLDLVEQVDDRGEVERDRLLAEGREAGRGRKPQQRCVPRRRGRDHERVYTGLDDRCGRLHSAHAELGREPVCARRVRVGERQRGHGFEA